MILHHRNIKKQVISKFFMAQCSKCGSMGRLLDVVGSKGVMRMCESCARNEGLPVLKRPSTFALKESEKPSGMYERLSKIAGLDAKEHMRKFSYAEKTKKENLKKQESSLKELVDKNYNKKVSVTETLPDDLIDNFHWVIMRARRMRKITREQLGKEIGESEAAIKLAEEGKLPSNYNLLVNKLESFLGIRIRKREYVPEKPRELDLGNATSRELTISDLKEMKAMRETMIMKNEYDEDVELNEEFKKKLDAELKGEKI